jgi:hypothetical protein
VSRYTFDRDDRFAIEGYNQTRPFASFLPDVAGVLGVPLWVFYVNRAQGIASFGVQDKDGPVVEYFPANRAYQLVSYTGFRTFVKIVREDGLDYYEPFSPIGLEGSRHCADFPKSRIYPGVPEYVNVRRRGMYHYLRG